ncbi:unnamed protein product [Phaedon cochleariae]|uniref:Uncharacterized protein n=1 Tax=Phaedon cochleariae TaxID=80249 RepID=A0A9P0DTH2_PHACE|nr:unnamed protein product [Phaedon cochleariae]
MGHWGKAIALTLAVVLSGPVRGTTYFEKTGSKDLEASATGFSYQVKSISPLDGKSDYEKEFEEYKSGPSVGRYSYDPVPLEKLPLSPNYGPSEAVYEPANSYGNPYAKGYDNFLDDGSKSFTDDYSFLKAGGSNFLNSRNSNDGEKFAKGYSDLSGFAKGLKGHHEKDSKSRFYDVLGGGRTGRTQEADQYSKHGQAAKGNKGGSFASEKSHDKGSKTSGYQKVYHKDEFKKDRVFYDKKNDKGHFNRYGNFDNAAASEAGAAAKGSSLDAAFEDGKYGARGLSDKGRFLDEDSGYNGAQGDAKYYRNGAAYANKGGKSFGTIRGYSER